MTPNAAQPDHHDLAAPISGDGFELVLVPGDVLRAVAEREPGAEPVEWPGIGPVAEELASTMPVAMRLRQLDDDPTVAAWLVRGIVVADPSAPTGRRLAGHAGGHDRPSSEGMVEVGYTVAAADRGRGLATAAARTWFAWAHRHGARVAQLSIEPSNVASTALAHRLGLVEVDRVWDEDDQVWEVVLTADLPLPGG